MIRHSPPVDAEGVETRTREIAIELIDGSRALGDHRSIQDRLTEWALSSEAFKVQLFRFIDAYPRFRTPEAVHRHLVEYLRQPGLELPAGMGLAIGAGGWFKGTLAKTIAGQIEGTAGRFIAGRDFADALPRLRDDRRRGLYTTIDLLGEAVLTQAEADAYQQRYLQLIEAVAGEFASPEERNVSIKLSSLTPRFDAMDFEGTIARVVSMLEPVLSRAAARDVLVNVDMESHVTKNLILTIFERCGERFDFRAGLALQAYLVSGDADAKRLIDWSAAHHRPITVRLVKGAYWDHEVIHAQERGWPCPVWKHKQETDACFERMTDALLGAAPLVRLACGSHNARSIGHALAVAESKGLPRNAVELQMLYGMADGLKATAVERGLIVRQYVPVGDITPGMAYLVRRLLENSSNQSWLLKGQDDKTPAHLLAAAPAVSSPGRKTAGPADRTGVNGFYNEPARDFSRQAARERFAETIATTTLPPVAINATLADADRAVAAARHAFTAWRDRPAIERALILQKAAHHLRQHRDELAAIMARESQKPWREADGDVCEAIDFCEFYALHAPALFAPRRLGAFTGERNEVWHEPRGVAAIISPWNFPLAICCGMTVAALVCGNCAIVKPAEQSPAIARRLCEALWDAGVPRDVLHYLPGAGETVGVHLVRHPQIDLIAFTGSKAVGLDILHAASRVDEAAGQSHVKHVVCEMGGKNAIVIDDTANLDEAVIGVRDSAFHYAGQKCSACSRVIVLPGVRDEFVARLVEATRHLVTGDAADPGTDVPPVIDDEAARKIWSYIDIGKAENRLLLGSPAPARSRLIPPHLFDRVTPADRLFREEIFGPVLAIVEAADFSEAIRLALTGPYRLTGGVYSRTPSHLEQAKREFRVGNLYLNRGITGALVGRQPFGGIGLSGTGTKAGGEEYLLQFVWPRSCAENTERRGFAAE